MIPTSSPPRNANTLNSLALLVGAIVWVYAHVFKGVVVMPIVPS